MFPDMGQVKECDFRVLWKVEGPSVGPCHVIPLHHGRGYVREARGYVRQGRGQVRDSRDEVRQSCDHVRLSRDQVRQSRDQVRDRRNYGCHGCHLPNLV